MQLFAKNTKKVPKDKKGTITLIIAAGGSGTRAGGVSKPLLLLGDKYAIEYSIEAFSFFDEITRIIISCKKEDIAKYEKIVKDKNYTKVSTIVEGGENRQESVSKAFKTAFSDLQTEFVAIHDGARPFVTREIIKEAILDAKKYGSAVCAVPTTDTMKRANSTGFVTDAVHRDGLYNIQTPQIFSFEMYATSLAIAERDGFLATDDSSLLENASFKVKLSKGSNENIKITYPEDIIIANALIENKNAKKEKENV